MVERYFVPDDAVFMSVGKVDSSTAQPHTAPPDNWYTYYPAPAPPRVPIAAEAPISMSAALPVWSHKHDPSAPLGSLHNPYPPGCAPCVYPDSRSVSEESTKTPESDNREGEESYYFVPRPRSKSSRKSRSENWKDYLEDVQQGGPHWRGRVCDPGEIGYYLQPPHPVPSHATSNRGPTIRQPSYEHTPTARARSSRPKSRYQSRRYLSPSSTLDSMTASTRASSPSARKDVPPLNYHVYHAPPTTLETPARHVSFREGPDSVLGSARGKWSPSVRRNQEPIGFRHVPQLGVTDASHEPSTPRNEGEISITQKQIWSQSDTPHSTRAVYGESPAVKKTPLQKLHLPDTPRSTRAEYGGSPYPPTYAASSTTRQSSPPLTTKYYYPSVHQEETAQSSSHQHTAACKRREIPKTTPRRESTHRRAYSFPETETIHASRGSSVQESEPSESHYSMPGSWDSPPPEKRYVLPVHEPGARTRRLSTLSPSSPKPRRKKHYMSGALPSPGHTPPPGPPSYRNWSRPVRAPAPPPHPPASHHTILTDGNDYYDYRAPIETVEIEKCHVCGWAPWEIGRNGVRFCWACWEEARDAEGEF